MARAPGWSDGRRGSGNRQHLVCRGLARALCREAGAGRGRVDYSYAIEREIEYAAAILSTRLVHGDRPVSHPGQESGPWLVRGRSSCRSTIDMSALSPTCSDSRSRTARSVTASPGNRLQALEEPELLRAVGNRDCCMIG
ncbi:hypothetical protein GCM10010231_37470 [Streptomyces sindenensis]|nr:hypothetical protein GCM10010231_37470 [Streptomyces sindenensis]